MPNKTEISAAELRNARKKWPRLSTSAVCRKIIGSGRMPSPARNQRPSMPRPIIAAIVSAYQRRSGFVRHVPITVEVPLPPSVNSLYATARHRATGREIRVLSKQGRDYKKRVASLIFAKVPSPCIAEVIITFRRRFITKAGCAVVWDATNRVKMLEDCVAQALGLDDCHNWHVSLLKVHAPAEKRAILTLTPITL